MQLSSLVGIAVLVMVALNVVTIAAILAAKVLRTLNESRLQSRRDHLEPALYEYLATGEVSPILHQAEDKDFLAYLIVEILNQVRGSQGRQLVELAGELGLVERDLERLDSRQRWRRAKAAENLGYYGGADAVGPVSGLLTDRDETVRAVVAHALSRLGTEDAAQALAKRLVSSSELTSLRMAENLERIGPLAVHPLIELLEGEKEEERQAQVFAAQVLGSLRVADARPALCRAIQRHWNTDLRAQATQALGRIGDPDDVPVILEAAEDTSWPVRVQAANALGMIGAVSTVPTLENLVTDEEWWVRLNASRALVNMGPEGESALTRLLESPDRFARDRAAAAMEERGVTRRLVERLAEPGKQGETARWVIRALLNAGVTRYLRRLSEKMPEGDERRVLQQMLTEVVDES